MISFSEHSEKYGLDDEEREILAAFEAGKVSPDADSEMNVETLRKAATETMREIAERRRTNATKPVTLRVPVRVIERYKKRASADGIGYQTLMNEILDAAMV
ncbi:MULTISPECIES: BrnA antitoxin family protein [Fibrobacter]|uniref:BrnA antitoxin of type II toxin-antitoxin system n=1 Tax=Fibrobacter intestinalis TaxID=28122 RepID=A0A1T4RS21_9BACT|nr:MULTISPECIES: BrnA antitoxin family protein [Fibrobacter]MDD7298453.1 BrnA antitoxin family protein [Fibrobacter intestinalis]PBC75331.1 BrnA antitoxin of type II toxin-antitoxin system [Fibrobacter sp. NR9]SKA18732.1 BrnA antitoxin of type II toxin-antitoxin system [Fibrobacter intestinalis]